MTPTSDDIRRVGEMESWRGMRNTRDFAAGIEWHSVSYPNYPHGSRRREIFHFDGHWTDDCGIIMTRMINASRIFQLSILIVGFPPD